MNSRGILVAVCLGLFALHDRPQATAAELLVEAESFQSHGGWQLDTQFIQQMGSPYLLAHGLGKPVADATTTIEVTEAGDYIVWVRTFDWVARWDAPGTPGRFQLLINDAKVGDDLGTQGKQWQWQKLGQVRLAAGEANLRLKDLTGFNGRCDAIYLTTNADAVPDNSSVVLSSWRRKLLGLDDTVEQHGEYDLVVVGGGYAGMGAAISAARMGCKVALIQDRGVLGGNGSSEVRVWAMGLIRRGKFPRIGEIVEEFADKATKSPGLEEEFGDEVKESVVRAEKNIDLYLHHHAFAVSKVGNKIESVDAVDVRSSIVRRFSSPLFADCTGHAWIGALADASWVMQEKGRMGMSNMWAWDEADEPVAFPETPWALPLSMDDFPYPRDHHAQWFWESGFGKDAIQDAESIRDWNLRAGFGAFNAMKNGDGAADHTTAYMTWMAYVGGPRESRLLEGDIVLTQDDVVNKRDFPDGCVPTTWSIDLHYPKKEYAEKFPDNPFISIAEHDRRIDRLYGYPVPYRCFYSKDVENLFMAGRCISVTHEALGTVRVMKTCGMMGEVVGKAASLCRQYECGPRDIYQRYLSDLLTMLQYPGKARRGSIGGPTIMPEVIPPLPGKLGPETGRELAKLGGVVVDETEAELVGKWTSGAGLKGYVGWGYHYAPPDSNAVADFRLKAPETSKYAIRVYYQFHENRGDAVPVDVLVDSSPRLRTKINMQQPADDGFAELGTLEITKDQVVTVRLSSEQAGGNIHADAAQLFPTP
jgi:hypothetical protein